ncbi:MAG: OPT family oligopeptide transporter [Thermoplasmatota archaeon]
MSEPKPHVPYIAPSRNLPEITIKAVVLGVLLAIILGAANAYLGLRVGQTVSASIPAAVVSMALLRFFKNRSILENNAVQTAASAGESLAAGVIFTVPALLVMGYWTEIHYWETTIIALVGGVLGVFFTVPLRRALIVEAQLKFPEGIATAEVLKAGEGGKAAGIVALALGAAAGAVYKFMEGGLKLFGAEAIAARKAGESVVAFGATLSPALLAVGFIVGLPIATLVFAGGVLGWLVGIPLYTAFASDAAALTAGLSPVDAAYTIWSKQIRYLGVGAMLVGGLWSLVKLRKPLAAALGSKRTKQADAGEVLRTDREIGMKATYLSVAALSIPVFGIYWFATKDPIVAGLLAVLMVILGFLFSAVAAYMAGLVGSSQNPISGVTIITVLAAAGLLYLLGVDVEVGPAAAIMVAAVIASAAAIGGDNMQDLKAGYLLGSTPRRQQAMQIVGVLAAGATVAWAVWALTKAYELGSGDLAAPQATLMASVAGGIFGTEELPYGMIGIGAALAVALITLDEFLEKRGSNIRTPVMPVAVGIYLPVGLSAPIFLGGLCASFVARYLRRRKEAKDGKEGSGEDESEGAHDGVLFASGLITGEALIGIVIASLVALEVEQGRAFASSLYLSDGGLQWPGLLLLLYLLVVLGYMGVRKHLVKS